MLSSDVGEWFERVAFEPSTAQALDDRKMRELVVFARDWIAHHNAAEPTMS